MQKTKPITRNADFVRLYKKGRTVVHPFLVLYIAKNRLNCNRLGITTSKKIGKAHERNRARRIIREAYRSLEPAIKTGYDIVFVARGRTALLKSTDVMKIAAGMFSECGVLEK